MLRVDRSPGGLTVVSRLARPRVLAVLGGGLVGIAVVAARAAPRAALALAAVGLLVIVLGARKLRARFERGQVAVTGTAPLARTRRRPLAAYGAVRIETFAEARRRRAEQVARGWAERRGAAPPAWAHPPDAPGANDALRRIVLVARDGEPLPVTSWLAEHEELEPARAAIEAVLG